MKCDYFKGSTVYYHDDKLSYLVASPVILASLLGYCRQLGAGYFGANTRNWVL